MSNFVVSARKYRPQRFDEVVGQQHISQTLKNALQSDHLAHAFLFCGPRGVGKTTCARILAKTLNCLQPSADFEPCNTCDNCQSFSKNASFNITELDAASNNSVEHIRALIEQVRFQPQQGKYKVFIIDEVHMLSQAAFNAFLKTLEEPPSYAIFILATTEKHKIIPTILSRCQIYDFKRIQVPDVVAHLADICVKEGIAADADALHVIGQKADGALRDALSIFDRIVSFSGKAISYQDVITNLNVLDYDYFFRVVDALLAEDLQQILLIYDDIDRKGFEGDLFINGLAQHVRNLLVCKDEQTLVLLDVGDGLRERYRQQATLCGNDFLLTALNLANDCDINYRMARNKRLQVEMTLMKMASIGRAFQLGSQPQAPAQEKKTADVTQPITAPGQPIPYIAPANASPHVVQEEPQKAYTTPTNGQASNAAAPAAAPAATPIPVLETANTLAKADLGAMMAAIKAEREEVVQRAHPVNLTEVQAAWDAYAAQVERDSLRYQLQSVQLELEGMTITAKVGSALVEGALRQETALTGQLRQQLKAPDLMLRIHIDPAMRKEEPEVQKTKLLTPNEKYKLMSEVNPDVRILIDTFELKPEN